MCPAGSVRRSCELLGLNGSWVLSVQRATGLVEGSGNCNWTSVGSEAHQGHSCSFPDVPKAWGGVWSLPKTSRHGRLTLPPIKQFAVCLHREPWRKRKHGECHPGFSPRSSAQAQAGFPAGLRPACGSGGGRASSRSRWRPEYEPRIVLCQAGAKGPELQEPWDLEGSIHSGELETPKGPGGP